MLRYLLIVTMIIAAFSYDTGLNPRAQAAGRVTIAGHRGYPAKYPENTLKSFEAAIKQHADFIEFDIQMTKDGVPVIIHDSTVDRTTNGHGRVRSFTFAQLQVLDAGAYFRPRMHGYKIPTLKQVLDLAARNHIKIYPEIKGYRTPSDIKVMIKQIIDAGFENTAVVESFHFADFKVVRSISKTIRLAYLANNEKQVKQVIKAAENDKRIQLFVWYKLLYNSEIMNSAHRRHIPVIAWTVDKHSDFAHLKRLGVDGIITNDVGHIQREHKFILWFF